MSRYLKTADNDWYKQRIIGIILVVLICFAALFMRLFYLQVIKGEEFRRLSDNNSIRLQRIEAFRGIIFDRNKNMLVDNRPSFDVSIVVKDAQPVAQTLGRLSTFLSVSDEELLEKIAGQKGILAYKPVLLRQDIGRDSMAGIEVHKYDLPGIEVNVKSRRHYLFGQSAAHILGYLGEISANELDSGKYPGVRSGDLIGKAGVERSYDEYLRGRGGGRQVEVNATGQIMRVLKTVPSRPGRNVVLTIDQAVQMKAEELLAGVTGAAVAIDPNTGEVLAIASNPSFDQNRIVSGMTHEQWQAFVSDPLKPLTNRAVQGEYPPASTYKILTATAGLEEGLIDENTEYCCPGFYRFKGREYRCWKRGGHGCLSLVQAIAQSCDVYFYQVGQAVGVDRLAWYAKTFGLGTPTGVQLANESSGLIPTAAWKLKRTGEPWQEGETLSLAIGQGFNLVTPLQMAGMAAAVANGGIRYQPQLLKRIETAQGEVVFQTEPMVVGKVPISPRTLELIRQGLWEVVHSDTGTAKGARFFDLHISGKTGTAQVISRKDDEQEVEDESEIADHLKAHAWFVAYAPSDAPQIATAVVVENGEHGSSAATPIAREIIKSYLLKEQLQPVIVANKEPVAQP
ncbi:MAG: peptidoglycan glycosyltransferase [Deltaproteobacteria bacterium SG8_13]|nr:MAG: peptidoglycan glycosyltransferase [Deltaproteobacteria bacterium SG8_13]